MYGVVPLHDHRLRAGCFQAVVVHSKSSQHGDGVKLMIYSIESTEHILMDEHP